VTYSSGMKNLPIAVGLAMASFRGQPLVGLPVALAFILQMLTASLFYRYLIRQRVGVPWRQIVAVAEELTVNMIVLGAHGKRGVKALLLGNTVENVTRHAPCPVMIIR
jgi:nucleotide-binding universal stress UspA family protein